MKEFAQKGFTLKNKAFKVSRGFTLIELLIAIGIIVLIAAVAIPNLRSFREDILLSQATNEVSSGLRKVQANAQSGVECSTGNISSSWSIFFIQSQSKFELICNYEADDVETSVTEETNTLSDIKLLTACGEQPPSDNKIAFTSISIGKSDVTIPCNDVSSIFTVTIESEKSGQTRNINIDSNGLIF